MKLKVTIAQYDIVWENKEVNLNKLTSIISSLKGKSDLVILPEMCTTGFSMNVENLAETNDGQTMTLLKKLSQEFQLAICGSYMAKDGCSFFNRGFFITPDNNVAFYDKRHLFRMGNESLHYQAGNSRLIIEHKGFKICLLICYDLRFPVWARNVRNEYDLLIYVANWPVSRIEVWRSLLTARAIENMAYVCGVNRVGVDGFGLQHNGNSMLIDAKGKVLSNTDANEQIESIELDLDNLIDFREKFPAWKDADDFRIIYEQKENN